MAHNFKQLLAGDELIRIFAAGRMIHPVLFDVVGMVGGFHGFWLDQEHCGLTYEQVVLASACGRANGFDNFVRMAMTDYSQATQNLEAGAGGLMAARIYSAAEAEKFVRWVKFAPRGERGLNSSGYDGHFGGKSQLQFTQDTNRDNLVIVQIETLSALEDVEAIAAVPDVDLLFVGPSDLSQELGIIGQFDHEKLWTAYEKISAACARHGTAWATLGLYPEFCQRAISLGCRMLSFGVDAILLRRGVEATRDQFAELFPPK